MGSEANDGILVVHHYGKTTLMWWPRIKKKLCVNELTQLLRTACIGITGAFRTTPTAALEVAIGSLPFHCRLRERPEPLTSESAALVATQRGNIVHLNFSLDTVLENLFNMRTYTVITEIFICKKIHSDIP